MASQTPFSTSIGSKILIRMLAVALAPLIVLSAAVFIGLNSLDNSAAARVDESRDELSEKSIAVTSEEQAASVAREINLILLERVSDVVDWAQNPLVTADAFAAELFARDEGLTSKSIDELEAQFDSRKSTSVAFDAQNFLKGELETKTDFREVFFTDPNGYNAALTAPTSDFVQSDEEWWQQAWANGLSIGDAEFDESAGVFSVDISVRIDDPNTSRRLGVMKAVLSISFVQSIAEARASQVGVDYVVALADGRLIAETATGHDADRMMNPDLDPASVSEGLVTALAPEATEGALIGEDNVFGYTRTLAADDSASGTEGFDGFDWVVVSSQPTDVAFAPLDGLADLKDDIGNSGSSLRLTVVILFLLGLAAAVFVSRLVARRIVDPIKQLTASASDAATVHLPAAVEHIDSSDPDAELVAAPEIELLTGDELEELAASFNSVQGTALELAIEQAANRRTTADMFVNLGRRNHSLIKRQLRFIDGLEQSETDPDTLESLFKLDHLATRMRRNAESLLVLAGERSPRRWSAPIEMRDAVQAALAEVEQYERVDVHGVGDGKLQGNVVADMAHILAELLENALNFSPPHAQVTVDGRMTAGGYVVTVTDEGLGMPTDELEAANDRLASAVRLSEVPAQYLGLFVVGRLAGEYNIEAALSASASGGTTATIRVPVALLPELSGEAERAREAGVTEDSIEVAEAEARAKMAAAQAELERIEAAKTRALAEAEKLQKEAAKAKAADEATSIDKKIDDDVEAIDASSGRRAGDDEGDPGIEARRSPDDSGAGTKAAGTETVEVDGIEFSRRGDGEESKRRETDASTAENGLSPDDDDAPDLESFGLTRRGSSGSGETKPKPNPKSKAKSAAPVKDVEGDVAVEAEAQKNQWSKFQKGKDAADTETDEHTS